MFPIHHNRVYYSGYAGSHRLKPSPGTLFPYADPPPTQVFVSIKNQLLHQFMTERNGDSFWVIGQSLRPAQSAPRCSTERGQQHDIKMQEDIHNTQRKY